MFLLPLLMAGALGYTIWSNNQPKKPALTPEIPSPANAQVIESEQAIRKRLSQTGRGTTIFTGGLFDNPTSRKERLIPV